MDIEFELERARKRVAWLEATEAFEVGNIYEFKDDNRIIVFVLTKINNDSQGIGQVTGMTLYDLCEGKLLSPHTVKFSTSVVDGELRYLTQYEATCRIDELNESD